MQIPAGTHTIYSRYHRTRMPCMEIVVPADTTEREVFTFITRWSVNFAHLVQEGDVIDLGATPADLLTDARIAGSWQTPPVSRITIKSHADCGVGELETDQRHPVLIEADRVAEVARVEAERIAALDEGE